MSYVLESMVGRIVASLSISSSLETGNVLGYTAKAGEVSQRETQLWKGSQRHKLAGFGDEVRGPQGKKCG